MNRERLENERHILENHYGHGPFVDGLIRQRVEEIDRRLAALPPITDITSKSECPHGPR